MATKTSTPANLRKELQKSADDALNATKSTVESVQRDLTDAAGDVQDAVQKVFLAGLGALVTGIVLLARDGAAA